MYTIISGDATRSPTLSLEILKPLVSLVKAGRMPELKPEELQAANLWWDSRIKRARLASEASFVRSHISCIAAAILIMAGVAFWMFASRQDEKTPLVQSNRQPPSNGFAITIKMAPDEFSVKMGNLQPKREVTVVANDD